MAVYVDEIRDWTLIARTRGLRHTHWCHLTADTEEELHTFAARLGLRRSWFQKKSDRDYRWHYDITPNKRAQAVRMGAQEVDRRFVGQLVIRRRGECDGKAPDVGPRCGNNPNVRLTSGDRQAVEEFKAYLAQRKADDAPRAATFQEEPMPDTGTAVSAATTPGHTSGGGSGYYAWLDGDEGAGWDH